MTNSSKRQKRPTVAITLKRKEEDRHSVRILFLSFYDPFKAETGPGAHLRGLSQSLCRLGCEVHILVLSSKRSNCLVNGIQLHFLNPSTNPFSRIPVANDSILSLIALREVDKLCKKHKIDIVHGQSPSGFGYGLLRRGEIPLVVTLHGTSFGELVSLFGAPISYINRHFVLENVLSMFAAFQTCIEYKYADKVIAVSNSTAEETIRYYRLPKDRVVAIHNGIDLPSFTDLQIEKENRERTMLSVGRLRWRKGYKYLIDAMPDVLAEYPDSKLLLVGDGEQKMRLQRQARKLGIESSVSFLGNISAEKLHSLYHEAEVYVQPSLYEPFGIAILEAMSMRKPIVATRVGGIPELITHGVEGLLVEPGNGLQLAKAITNIFSDSSFGRGLGSNARKRVEKEFTWKAIAQKTFEFYMKLLNDR